MKGILKGIWFKIKFLFGLIVLIVLVFGCAFFALSNPDAVTSVGGTIQSAGQVMKAADTAKKVSEVGQTINNIGAAANDAGKAVGGAVQQLTKPNDAPARQPADTAVPIPTQAPPATAVPQAGKGRKANPVVINTPTSVVAPLPKQAVDVQLSADVKSSGNIAGAAVEKVHADKLAVSISTESMNLHYLAVDSYNNTDATKEEDFPILVSDWCQVIAQKSVAAASDSHSILSFGAQSAIAHAVTLDLHGQSSQLNAMITFTVNVCKVSADQAKTSIKMLVSHP